jgi:serine/threonine protein kinase
LEQKDLFSRLVAHIDSSGEDEGLSGVNIKIKRELGRGVYGTVYLGQIKVNTEDGSPVVVKRSEHLEPASPLLRLGAKKSSNVDVAVKVVSVIHSDKRSSSEENLVEKDFEKKIERDRRRAKQRYSHALMEAQHLHKVSSHPSIVTFVGARLHEDKLWLITEYCPAGNLNDYLRKGNVSLPRRQMWYFQLLSGVSYLHCNQIGHFDLKPHNILLDENYNLKIADFGISASVSEQEMTILGVFKYVTPRGSLPYMAPEGFSGKLSLKADIFSLGLVFVTISERPVYEIHGNQVFYYPVAYKEAKTQKGQMKADFVGRRMAADYNRGCSQLALNSPAVTRGDHTQPKELPSADAVARVVGRRVLRGVPWQQSTDDERKLFCSMLRVLPQHRSDYSQLKELISAIYTDEIGRLQKKPSTGTQKLRKPSSSTGKLDPIETENPPPTQQQAQQQSSRHQRHLCCIQ